VSSEPLAALLRRRVGGFLSSEIVQKLVRLFSILKKVVLQKCRILPQRLVCPQQECRSGEKEVHGNKSKLVEQGTNGCGVEGSSDLPQCDSVEPVSKQFHGDHLEKLTVPQLVKKFRIFDVTQSFITAFRIARHWSLSTAS
jgi:hypothetical protein